MASHSHLADWSQPSPMPQLNAPEPHPISFDSINSTSPYFSMQHVQRPRVYTSLTPLHSQLIIDVSYSSIPSQSIHPHQWLRGECVAPSHDDTVGHGTSQSRSRGNSVGMCRPQFGQTNAIRFIKVFNRHFVELQSIQGR